MELFSLSVFAVTIPAVVFAGISKGGFGSGVAFASSSILALLIDPALAMALMLPLLMLIDVASLPSYWRKWDWPAARVLMLGAVPGTLLGALFFSRADADMIRMVIGLVCVLFVGWQAARKYGLVQLGQARFGPKVGLVSGVVMGFTSFVSHAGGPAAAVFLLGQGLSKNIYQATTVLVFWAVNFFKSGFYIGMGIFTRETLLLDIALIPFALLGTWIGIRAHDYVSDRVFFGITYVALTITGTKLVFDALT
ncbi:MAG: sulfite exporter TauE/SafE family protein [Pelagimonas sp.]|uniref:sulfite exporter TauE/SafE family protein n=1 Tax=Pelagimonas sp. TaxID=2073170 RepID=UPI003D6A4633